MNFKRQRGDAAPFDREQKDHYEEVMQIMNGNGDISNLSTNIRSSWMLKVKCISPSSPSMNSDFVNVAEIKQELQHTAKQLLQVKRRMGPAAERTTEAYNFNHGDATTGRREFDKARRACNPFEILGEHGGLNTHFMNRSAIKLANIDAALGFNLTKNGSGGNFLFADICAAPGGFSEYILWRCSSNNIPVCRGYGMSLIGTNDHGHGLDWKLHSTSHEGNGPSSHYRVCEGADGTGDIYRWENVEYLQNIIRSDYQAMDSQDESGKVHLVLADGGFDAQRDNEDQEQITQKLIVCQTAAALALLQRNGTYVMKMFGFQTPVARAVMNYLYFSFENIVAIKPISSRPASAERYICCAGFRGNIHGWDGRKWCDAMFLGQQNLTSGIPNTPCDNAAVENLNYYLDDFDRNMCNLNLKACFAILSHLENKCARYKKIFNPMTEESDDEIPSINVAAYKYAWQLV